MAVRNNPRASAGVAGAATYNPGKYPYSASSAWECCADSCTPAPFGPRMTIGTPAWPPEKYRIFAAFWMIWSAAISEKFHVMTSMTGRRPSMAIPIPRPPDGRGHRRVDDALGAVAREQPLRHEKRAPVHADVLAHQEDA